MEVFYSTCRIISLHAMPCFDHGRCQSVPSTIGIQQSFARVVPRCSSIMQTRYTSPCAPGSEFISLFMGVFSRDSYFYRNRLRAGTASKAMRFCYLWTPSCDINNLVSEPFTVQSVCISLFVDLRNTTCEAPSGPLNSFEPRHPERSVDPGKPCNSKCLGLGYVRRVSAPGDAPQP